MEVERLGAEVMVAQADAGNREEMFAMAAQARERFGEMHGVIHAAGLAGDESYHSIQETDRQDCGGDL